MLSDLKLVKKIVFKNFGDIFAFFVSIFIFNSWAAAWIIGDTDKSLPSDMGHILGEYIATVVPARAVPTKP